MVAGGAEEALDEGAPVEGLGPGVALPGQGLSVAFVVGVLDGDGPSAAARSLLMHAVRGMVCGSRMDAGVFGHLTLNGWNSARDGRLVALIWAMSPTT